MRENYPHILLVEDSSVDAQLVKYALKKIEEGLEVVWLSNGLAAIEYLKSRPNFSGVMLLDLKMPGDLDGFGVLESLQKEQLKSFPVVIFSSSDLPEDSVKAFQLGADEYFQKPFDFIETQTIMNYILQRWLLPDQGEDLSAAMG